MIGNAHKLVVDDKTHYWTPSKDGGVVLDLGERGKHAVGLAFVEPERWYCTDPHCGCGHYPPTVTPRIAGVLARILLADDLTLEPEVVIEHVWKVTSVRRL